MEAARPLDTLNQARGKQVLILSKLKNSDGVNVEYVGKLVAFDIHINISLTECEERVNGQVTRKLGKTFIRGDTIVFICPQ